MNVPTCWFSTRLFFIALKVLFLFYVEVEIKIFLFCTQWQGRVYLFAEGQLDMFGSSSIEGWLQIQLSSQVRIPLVNKFYILAKQTCFEISLAVNIHFWLKSKAAKRRKCSYIYAYNFFSAWIGKLYKSKTSDTTLQKTLKRKFWCKPPKAKPEIYLPEYYEISDAKSSDLLMDLGVIFCY